MGACDALDSTEFLIAVVVYNSQTYLHFISEGYSPEQFVPHLPKDSMDGIERDISFAKRAEKLGHPDASAFIQLLEDVKSVRDGLQ